MPESSTARSSTTTKPGRPTTLPRLGERLSDFAARLGASPSVAVHSLQLCTYAWGSQRLSVLFDRDWAIAVHCRYPEPQPVWVALADSACFTPSGARQKGPGAPRFERQSSSWTLSSGTLSFVAYSALVNA